MSDSANKKKIERFIQKVDDSSDVWICACGVKHESKAGTGYTYLLYILSMLNIRVNWMVCMLQATEQLLNQPNFGLKTFNVYIPDLEIIIKFLHSFS